MSLSPLAIQKNPSYSELRQRVVELTEVANALTAIKVSPIASNAKPTFTLSATNSTLNLPDLAPIIKDVEELKAAAVECEEEKIELEKENEVLLEDYCNSLSAFSVLTGIDSSGGYLTQQTGSACIKSLTPSNPCTPQAATILIGKREDNTWELKYYSDGGFPNNRWIVQGPIPEGGSSRVPFLGPIVSGASGTLTINPSDWLGIPLEIVAYYNPNPVPTSDTQLFGIFPLEDEQTTCE